jgi:hypothetical protein
MNVKYTCMFYNKISLFFFIIQIRKGLKGRSFPLLIGMEKIENGLSQMRMLSNTRWGATHLTKKYIRKLAQLKT